MGGLKLKDLKAKNYLFQAIDRFILETILISKETSKDIWDSMKKKYQDSSSVKRAQLQALRKDFETQQMKDGEFVTHYCARTMVITNKMRFHGEKMEDVAIVEKILRFLASKFDYVVCSIEESKDIDAHFLDELQSSLLVHGQKLNRSSTIEEQALKASTHSANSRGRDRGRGRRRGDRGNRDGNRHFKADDDQFQDEKKMKLDDKGEKCVFLDWVGAYSSHFDSETEEERQQPLHQQIPATSISKNLPNVASTAPETSTIAAEATDTAAESRLHRV
uniref:Uncharacterized protein LOC105059982 n=1 Tax=Elaeis guineensis var. tenera TaxID=51953 RepID=A0A6I9SEU6_ELAGV|nr:uncharacterized protein LOC105059982 [Elaeis guineensis]